MAYWEVDTRTTVWFNKARLAEFAKLFPHRMLSFVCRAAVEKAITDKLAQQATVVAQATKEEVTNDRTRSDSTGGVRQQSQQSSRGDDRPGVGGVCKALPQVSAGSSRHKAKAARGQRGKLLKTKQAKRAK